MQDDFGALVTFVDFAEEDFPSLSKIKRKYATHYKFPGWEIRGSTAKYGSDEVFKNGVKVAAIFKPGDTMMFLTDNPDWQRQITTFVNAVVDLIKWKEARLEAEQKRKAEESKAVWKAKQDEAIRKAFES